MGGDNFRVIRPSDGVPIKAWIKGVPFEPAAEQQLKNTAAMPFVYKWIAAMPDVHLGLGATIGSVIPTTGAIIPAAVGVDLGCGMMAVRTSLTADRLPDRLGGIQRAIERAVPHGRTDNGGRNDRGAWREVPNQVTRKWTSLENEFCAITHKYFRGIYS